MMPRKKRKLITIISIVIAILVILIIFAVLYITTDMFKSNSLLFTKYIGQNIENVKNLCEETTKNEYNDLLKTSKYTNETKINVNYTQNINTTSESMDNSINQLKLEINGQTDNINNYDYQDIKLLRENEDVSEVKYIKNNNTYGLQFPDIISQYVLVNNENLQELFKSINDEEEQSIPDKIEFNNDFYNIFDFSEEEIENLKTKYANIILNNISTNNFSKLSNQDIQIDEKNIKANSYTLTLTKEQLNNIYIKILEELKQDEIILSKIEIIEQMVNQYEFITGKNYNLKDDFEKSLENIIDNIVKNNIGQDECKIVVYESKRQTVRTVIYGPDYEINIDLLSTEGNYLQISYKKDEKEKTFTYKKNNNQTNIILKNIEEKQTKIYDISINEKIDGNNCSKNVVVQYEDNNNKVEMDISNSIKIVENLANEVALNDKNSINLSELEPEQVKIIIQTVNEEISKKIEEITTTQINVEDLRKVLITVGLEKEEQLIESTGVTETQRNRFNSKFEILQGEKLESKDILNIVNAIKDNLIEIEKISDTQIKLKLDPNNKNEELITTLNNYIESNKTKKYNVTIEYDEQTKLVSDILLTILEK